MIIRRKRKDRFTIVANRSIEDDRLSFDALGLLTYLLSRPDDWEVQVDQLKLRGGIGKHKLYRILKELTVAGYVTHERERDTETGSFTVGRYVVYDEPQAEKSSIPVPETEPRPENQNVGGIPPHPDFPDDGLPDVGNRDVYKELTPTKDERERRLATTEKQGDLLSESRPSSAREKFKPKWRPIAPDLTKAREAREAIFAVWIAEGHAGATGSAEEADEALAELDDHDIEAAAERALRTVRAMRQAGRSHIPQVVTYVKKRLFDQHPPPAFTGVGLLEVKPRTREWCAMFWALVAAANKTATGRARAMMRDAKFGRPFHVRQDELPTLEEQQAMVKIERNGEEFSIWRRHLGFRGPRINLWLEPEAFGEWLWVPTRLPPFEGIEIGKEQREDAA